MPKIRYMRNEDGAEKMYDDGYCWVDAFIWQWDIQELVSRGLKKNPHLKARHFVPTIEDVSEQSQCGYCQRCTQGLEETTNER